MARVRDWSALSQTTRERYQRNGITESVYESGASLRAARGHANTPEHPEQGRNRPEFESYYQLREDVRQLKREVWGHLPGKGSMREMSKKGKASLQKAKDYLEDMAAGGWDWDTMVRMYPELESDDWDWLTHYH